MRARLLLGCVVLAGLLALTGCTHTTEVGLWRDEGGYRFGHTTCPEKAGPIRWIRVSSYDPESGEPPR